MGKLQKRSSELRYALTGALKFESELNIYGDRTRDAVNQPILLAGGAVLEADAVKSY